VGECVTVTVNNTKQSQIISTVDGQIIYKIRIVIKIIIKVL